MGRERIDVTNEQMKKLLDDVESTADHLTLKIASVVGGVEIAKRIAPSIAWLGQKLPEEHILQKKDNVYSVILEIVNKLELSLEQLRSTIQLILVNIRSLENSAHKTDVELDVILAASAEIYLLVEENIDSFKEQAATLSEIGEIIDTLTFGTVSSSVH